MQSSTLLDPSNRDWPMKTRLTTTFSASRHSHLHARLLQALLNPMITSFPLRTTVTNILHKNPSLPSQAPRHRVSSPILRRSGRQSSKLPAKLGGTGIKASRELPPLLVHTRSPLAWLVATLSTQNALYVMLMRLNSKT